MRCKYHGCDNADGGCCTIWSRRTQDLSGLVHHSDRGSQYLSIRYTERLADEQAVVSVGSRGDSYDNALAESVIGLFKTEVVKKQGPWRSFEQLELGTARWVDWPSLMRQGRAPLAKRLRPPWSSSSRSLTSAASSPPRYAAAVVMPEPLHDQKR